MLGSIAHHELRRHSSAREGLCTLLTEGGRYGAGLPELEFIAATLLLYDVLGMELVS